MAIASIAEAGRVKGYYRKNGTYVAPHYRSAPDGKLPAQKRIIDSLTDFVVSKFQALELGKLQSNPPNHGIQLAPAELISDTVEKENRPEVQK